MNRIRLAAAALFGKRWFGRSRMPVHTEARLDKRRVKRALELARHGDTRELSALKREMIATSTDLGSHVRKIALALQQVPLEISAPSGQRNSLADDIAGDCKEQICNPDIDLQGTIEHALMCYLDGAGGFEMAVSADGIDALTPVPTERYWWENGVHVVQPGESPSERVPVEELGGAAPTLVVSPTTVERDLVGVLRSCITPWLTARWGIEWWADAVERDGVPFRYAGYGPQDNPEDLLSKLQGMGSGGVGVFPIGIDVKFLESASTFAARPHQELVEFCHREQAKGLLGGTQTADIQKGSGSKSSAGVHQDMFDTFVDGYGLAICTFLRRSVLKPYVAYRYGPIAARKMTPLPVLKGKRFSQLLAFFDAMEKAGNFGLETIPVAWVHAQTGIPVPESGEACVKIRSAQPKALPAAPGDPAEDPATINQASIHRGAVDFETRCKRKAAGEILAPYRSLIDQAAKEGASLSELYMRLIRESGLDTTSPKLVDALAALQVEGFMEGYTAERDRRWK